VKGYELAAKHSIPTMMEWLKANQIDPQDVPLNSDMWIEGQVLHYSSFVRGEENRVVYQYSDEGNIEMEAEKTEAPLLISPLVYGIELF
jgi:hypothetical protein